VTTLPDGWTVEPFASVATYTTGRTPARVNSKYWNGAAGTPWVSIADMEPYGSVVQTNETITELALNEVFRGRVVPAGTVLMSFKLTIGRVATLSVPACHNEAIIAIYPRSDIDQRFLGYYLSQVDYSELQDRQVKGQTLNQDKIDRIPVVLPTAGERRCIADVLDRVRAGIAIEARAEELATEVKRAAMREMFTRGLRGKLQKETEIGSLPDSWDVACVGDHALMVSKGASPKWQGFNYVSDGVLFVRSQNVGNGFVDWRDKVYLPPEWNEKEKRSVLKAGDVLINLVGASIGRSAVGGPEIEGANCNQAVCFVRLRQGEIHPRFLSGFLLTSEGQRQIHGSKKDIARANLSLEDVRQILIPRPPLDEQQEIVAILDAIDHKIDVHSRKRDLLDKLFKSLLHKLMTGEICVSDLDLSALPSPAEGIP
jgi:type I restriction enzyme S subunit